MHDFMIYDTKPFRLDKSSGYAAGDVILKLTETLPAEKNHMMFFDNWFHFLELQPILAERRYRLRQCPIEADNVIKKRGRGSYNSYTDAGTNITVAQWYDNKTVLVASNFLGVKPLDSVQRWN